LTINIETELWITNQRKLLLTGSSEPLTSIFINELKILTDNRGLFQHGLRLHEGRNEVEVIAKSQDKRESSLKRTIILDTIPPYLEASIHKNTENQEEWIVMGSTEPNTQITILDSTYSSLEDGSFAIPLRLPEELTSLSVVCQDKVGNVTSKSLSIIRKN